MKTKRDKLITVYVSEGELQTIADCADAEKVSPNMWVRRVVTDIAGKFARLMSAPPQSAS
jgi:hypothetical protein